MKDEKIIELFEKRDDRAVEYCAEKYGRYCHSIAAGILPSREDAEECVNDTWLRVWNSIPPQKPTRFSAFLAKVTRNLALDRYRAISAEKRGGGEAAAVFEELEECLSGGSTPEEELSAEELARSVNDFVAALPRREREIFIMRYFYVRPVREIADTCGLTPGNVSVILNRCRKKLKTHLETEGYEL